MHELTSIPLQLEAILTKLSDFPKGSLQKRLEQITVEMCTFFHSGLTLTGS